jgi:hypothetical protein
VRTRLGLVRIQTVLQPECESSSFATFGQDDARKIWMNLQAYGWRQCTDQWGEDAKVRFGSTRP